MHSWSYKDVNANHREPRTSLGQLSPCPYKCPHFCPCLWPLAWLVQVYHPQGNSSLSRHIWSNFKWNELCSQVPMSIVVDTVWMGRLKGAIIPSLHKNHPVLVYTQSYDHFHYIVDNYSGSIPLYIKYTVPANDCSIRTPQSSTSGSFITTTASQISLGQCTTIPRKTLSQNSNLKFMGK